MYVLLLYEANFIYLIMVSASYVLGTIIFVHILLLAL